VKYISQIVTWGRKAKRREPDGELSKGTVHLLKKGRKRSGGGHRKGLLVGRGWSHVEKRRTLSPKPKGGDTARM